jgi:hypothetical protein
VSRADLVEAEDSIGLVALADGGEVELGRALGVEREPAVAREDGDHPEDADVVALHSVCTPSYLCG